jgi:hypothetical protein
MLEYLNYLLIQVFPLIMTIWFGSAFLYQAIKWRNLGIFLVGIGFLVAGTPFLIRLLAKDWGFYNIFVWTGIALGCFQWRKYTKFLEDH